jgi:hypothetical protein
MICLMAVSVSETVQMIASGEFGKDVEENIQYLI